MTTHRLGRGAKRRLASGILTIELDPFDRSGVRRGRVDVAVIDIGGRDRVTGCALNISSEAHDSFTIVDISGGHMQSKKMAECIDRHMNHRPTLPLSAVISGAQSRITITSEHSSSLTSD